MLTPMTRKDTIVELCEVENNEKIGLASIREMLKFYAGEFAVVMHNLELLRHQLINSQFGGLEGEWEQAEQFLADTLKVVKEIPLSNSLASQVERALSYAKRQDANYAISIEVIVGEISHNIVSEVESFLFFSVRAHLKGRYLTPERVIGEALESAFPDAVKDAHDGIRCFVLDQWTASVFHFMRVLEHGIRYMSTLVQIPTDNIALESWKNALDQIEKKIRDMEQLPRTEQKIQNLKFLSEAAINFRYFKDAWRNHVSHSRAHYDTRDAQRVMNHVLDFMQQLARPLSS